MPKPTPKEKVDSLLVGNLVAQRNQLMNERTALKKAEQRIVEINDHLSEIESRLLSLGWEKPEES